MGKSGWSQIPDQEGARKRIDRIRQNKQLTLAKFASIIGMSRGGFGTAMSGQTSITVQLVDRVAQAFDVKRDWLISGEGDPYDLTFAQLNKPSQADIVRMTIMQVLKTMPDDDVLHLANLLDLISKTRADNMFQYYPGQCEENLKKD